MNIKDTVNPTDLPNNDRAAAKVELALWRAALPVAVLITYLFAGIYIDGVGKVSESIFPLTGAKLSQAFGAADVPVILVTGSLLASLVAWLCLPRPVQKEGGQIYLSGIQSLFQPVLILISAWVLSSVLSALGAADYLGLLLDDTMSPALFPATVFLLGAIVSFTTGTSWGTMGLLMPLVVPVSFQLGPEGATLISAVVGAVFSGAVFGDHCSPLSDTTIVSSFACGVDPVDHVKTQLPYAMVAAIGALLLGFIPAGHINGGWSQLVISGGLFAGICVAASYHQRDVLVKSRKKA